jgi:4'-phosphopantetheinyl transferase
MNVEAAKSAYAGEIHLWLAFYGEAIDGRLRHAYRGILNAAERAQETRFYFARDRIRYLVTRALVRTVLSRYAPIRPAQWVFSTNQYGRPRVANPGMAKAGLDFNLSHAHGLIALAVARDTVLGVDVENIHVRPVSIGIAERFFAPEEAEALAAVPNHQQQFRFFEYWTFKESYIKARGRGLSLPLDKFRFRYPDTHTVEIAIDPELADDPARWRFWQFRPTANHLIALCAERSGGQPSRVTAWRTTPLVEESTLALEPGRHSG